MDCTDIVCRYVRLKEIVHILCTIYCIATGRVYYSIQAYKFNCMYGLVKLLVP